MGGHQSSLEFPYIIEIREKYSDYGLLRPNKVTKSINQWNNQTLRKENQDMFTRKYSNIVYVTEGAICRHTMPCHLLFDPLKSNVDFYW